jgi:hypothetical protein
MRLSRLSSDLVVLKLPELLVSDAGSSQQLQFDVTVRSGPPFNADSSEPVLSWGPALSRAKDL